MQIKQVKQDGLHHEFEITISANDIDARVDSRLQEVGKTMKLPGFRPGKVPLDILKKRYGKAIMGEVLEAAVNETSTKALQDKNIKPALQPKIEVKEFDDGKDLVYSIAIEAIPEFKVTDLKSLKIEKPVAKVQDENIDEALTRIASNNPGTSVVEASRASKDGDTLVIDFDGRTADDNVHHQGMKAEAHHLKLGSGMFIPGFEEQLVGKKKGDKVDVKVSFPENYGAKELAGRDAIFEVTIHELREESEAKIDDEFAVSLGLKDLAALKDAVRKQIEREYDMQSRMIVKKNILDRLDETHDFEIPQTLVEMEHRTILDQIEMQRKQSGEDTEGLSKEDEAEYKKISERRVRLGLVLAEIGNANKITVSDPELQKAVIAEAQKYPGQEREVFDYFTRNRAALEGLKAPVFEEKVIDYILAIAQVSEKSVTAEELAKALDEGDDAEEKPAKKKSSDKSGDKKSASKSKKAS
jgi:trigger factor